LIRPFLIFIVCIALTSCSGNDYQIKNIAIADTLPAVAICDSCAIDQPKIKDYRKELSVWLETSSLDWFLEKRQSAWREAKAWEINTILIDSNPILNCLSAKQKDIFLYIPNRFYEKAKNGNEYFQFFIVNNSKDSILIPRLDAVINNISSSISYTSNLDSLQKWLSFQETNKFVECGNSYWTMKLPPRTAIRSQIESGYLFLGDTAVNYRLELMLGKQKIISNSIKINLMKKQLPYLGKPFD
jgi:hypothetical protein